MTECNNLGEGYVGMGRNQLTKAIIVYTIDEGIILPLYPPAEYRGEGYRVLSWSCLCHRPTFWELGPGDIRTQEVLQRQGIKGEVRNVSLIW